MKLIDCNGFIGSRQTCLQGCFSSTHDYIRYMDMYGISEAFVHHAVSYVCDCAEGNGEILKTAEIYERLHPVWVVMPHYTGEFCEPAELVKRLAYHNVKLVRLCPRQHSYSLGRYCVGELLNALSDANVPILIEMGETSPDELSSLLDEYKKLNIIVTNMGYSHSRCIYPLLTRYNRLFLDLSGVRANLDLENICERFSSEHIIFGTNMPLQSGASAVALLMYARISDCDRENIAFKNLEGLIHDKR